ncbi:MAG: hypothetical protein LBH42_04820 [Treponema sp.]|nr:hypothetical protein [Treponema sp.]
MTNKLFIVLNHVGNNKYELSTAIEDDFDSFTILIAETDYDCTALKAIKDCFGEDYMLCIKYITLPSNHKDKEKVITWIKNKFEKYFNR